MPDNFLYGRFTATYQNDCTSYTANDWKDAMNQALDHRQPAVRQTGGHRRLR
jgi:hypothetical protein